MSSVASYIPQPMQGALGESGAAFADMARRLIGRPPVGVVTQAGALDAGARVVTFRVVNCIGQACRGRFAVLVIISAGADGEPGGTQTVTVTTGKQASVLEAGRALIALTDDDGVAAVRVQAAAGESRYVFGVAIGPFDAAGPLVW